MKWHLLSASIGNKKISINLDKNSANKLYPMDVKLEIGANTSIYEHKREMGQYESMGVKQREKLTITYIYGVV